MDSPTIRQLNLVYFGTANAAPYDLRQLGPAKLDSLFTASIIALDAATGRMAWYYQTTPRDSWDYDSVQKMILADCTMDGRLASVIMQAYKNGFFYVLDRKTGKLLSAKNFTFVELGIAHRHEDRAARGHAAGGLVQPRPRTSIRPGPGRTHGIPMSYSAQTHLVYIPVIDVLRGMGGHAA